MNSRDTSDGPTMATATVDIPPDDLARARELGIDISGLVRAALTERLSDEAFAQEVDGYVAAFAEFGPAEDWSDWADVPK